MEQVLAWTGNIREKRSPRHKTFAGFVFKESRAKKVFMAQVWTWKRNIKRRKEPKS